MSVKNKTPKKYYVTVMYAVIKYDVRLHYATCVLTLYKVCKAIKPKERKNTLKVLGEK